MHDCTHYVEAKCGFSVEIDSMLKSASKVDTCPGREKCAILLIDEMHIREDLVYDKHSGELIGFTNMDDISNNLAQLERSMSESNVTCMAQVLLNLCLYLWCVDSSVVCSFHMFILPAMTYVDIKCMILFGKRFGGLRIVG